MSGDIQVTGFQLIEKLGEGGMGAVHRARQIELERDVALKILLPHAITDERLQARFRREAEIQATLVHPNLVRVYDAGADGDTRWIAMELVSGGTLAQVIDRRGRLPAEFLAPGLLQLATGLAFLHEHEVIHRDLKPGNVMLSDAGVIKITDFGLARRAGQTALTATGSMVGTLAYMSPEAVTGQEVGAPNDMYALGLIAYEMATGTLPYKGEDMADWVAAIIQAPIGRPSSAFPEVPGELDDLILALLEREAAKRPTAAEACRRLKLLADTGGMNANTVTGAVRKLLEELRGDGSRKTPSWRDVEVKPALDAVAALGAVPPPGEATVGAEPATEESMPSAAVLQAARGAVRSKPEPAGGEVAGRGSSWAGPLIAIALALAAAAGGVVWRSTRLQEPDGFAQRQACARRLENLALLAAKKVAGAAGGDTGPCPARGVYALNEKGDLACDAPGHAASAPLAERPAEGERAAFELALTRLLIAASPEFEGCVDRQRQILDAAVGRETTIEDLKREHQDSLGPILRLPGENYTLSAGVLECSNHPSVQRIAKRIPAFSVLPSRGK